MSVAEVKAQRAPEFADDRMCGRVKAQRAPEFADDSMCGRVKRSVPRNSQTIACVAGSRATACPGIRRRSHVWPGQSAARPGILRRSLLPHA